MNLALRAPRISDEEKPSKEIQEWLDRKIRNTHAEIQKSAKADTIQKYRIKKSVERILKKKTLNMSDKAFLKSAEVKALIAEGFIKLD